MSFILPVLLSVLGAGAVQGASGWTEAPGSSSAAPLYVRTGRTQTVAQVTPHMSLDFRLAAPALLEELVGRGLCPAGGAVDARAEATVAAAADADRGCVVVATPIAGGSRVTAGLTAGPDRLEPEALARAVAELLAPAVVSVAAAPPSPRAAPAQPMGGGSRPVGAVLRGANELQGMPLQAVFTVTPWLLYPGGVAAACPDADPGALPLEPAALDARDDCQGGRWRRGAAGVELQTDEDGAWSGDGVWEQKPLPPGATLDFDGAAKGGMSFHDPLSGVAAFTVLRNGQLRLTRDGRMAGAAAVTSGYNAKRTTETALIGRYRLDGFVIEITTTDGIKIRRPFVFSEEDSAYRGAYFAGETYLQPK